MENTNEINIRNCSYYSDKDCVKLYAIENIPNSIGVRCYALELNVPIYPELPDDFVLLGYSEMINVSHDFFTELLEFKCTIGIRNILDRYLWLKSIGGLTKYDLGLEKPGTLSNISNGEKIKNFIQNIRLSSEIRIVDKLSITITPRYLGMSEAELQSMKSLTQYIRKDGDQYELVLKDRYPCIDCNSAGPQ